MPQTALRLLQRCNHSSCSREKVNARLFPVHCGRCNVPKTENLQDLSPIRFCNRGNCNVANNRILFCVSWKSERSLFFSLWQQSYNFAKQRIFKAFHSSARLFVFFVERLQRCNSLEPEKANVRISRAVEVERFTFMFFRMAAVAPFPNS